MDSSDRNRLSVALVDVAEGKEAEFAALADQFGALLVRKRYGISEMIRDEAHPLRFYSVRRWNDAASAAACHADLEAQSLTARLYQLARVTHIVNGAHPADSRRLILDDQRARVEADRRTGFDRRVSDQGRPEGDRRTGGPDRRLGPRRLQYRFGQIDLVAAARRAREHADVAFSHFKVGAAIETADGLVVTGCNIETRIGLTTCAERVAMFKALSEGHRMFTRIAIVADADVSVPPCGACRQILWEFGGNLEVQLANLRGLTGTHQLKDLLPMPFDARLL